MILSDSGFFVRRAERFIHFCTLGKIFDKRAIFSLIGQRYRGEARFIKSFNNTFSFYMLL